MTQATIKFETYDRDQEIPESDYGYVEKTYELPAKWEICRRCRGDGTHTNPNIDGNGIASDEMHELGPDFTEDYLGGVYDVACSGCGGSGKNLVVDRHLADPKILAYMDEDERDLADSYAISEAERMAGA